MSQSEPATYPESIGWAIVVGAIVLLLVAEGWLFFVAT